MKTLLNTLYVTNPGAVVRLEGSTICVEIEKKKALQVPLHHIGSLVCFGEVFVTSAVMQKCTTEGKSICFLDRRGRFAARVEGPVSGNVLLRINQFQSFSNGDFNLSAAKSFVGGKVHNSRQILLRGARETTDDAERQALNRTADLLVQLLRKVKSCENSDQVRGFEGEAARLYFEALNLLVRFDKRAVFSMKSRSRRPPLDPFNALISFLYTLLVNDCRGAVEAIGLDSQVGFLHVLRPGRPALALDLMEEFRPILADRLALSLINRGQVKESDFEIRPGGAVQMNDDCRKVVISSYQKRKQEELAHPLLKEKVELGLIVHLQARVLARTIRNDINQYIPFLYR